MGKLLVYGIVFAAFTMGATVFWTLKKHPMINQSISTQLKTEFMSYATELKATKKLQVAELKQSEVFERTDSLSIFWNTIKLSDVVVSITTPVTFNYFVDLDAPWTFEIQNKAVLVLAPKIEFNSPAPDLSATQFEIRKGSMFRDGNRALEQLRTQISGLLQIRAQENIHLVRETARAQIRDFVMLWMQKRFPNDKALSIKVQFLDETGNPS